LISFPNCPDWCSDGRCADFLVTVRSDPVTPLEGADVWIDFSGCPDIQICCDQLLSQTGQTEAPPRTVSGVTGVTSVTNGLGQFTFRVQGAGDPASLTSTPVGVPCANIWANSVPPNMAGAPVLLGSLVVSAYDVNGVGTTNNVSTTAAVNSIDASVVANDALKVAAGSPAWARDDYNFSNSVNAADVAISASMGLQQLGGTGTKITSTPLNYCP